MKSLKNTSKKLANEAAPKNPAAKRYLLPKTSKKLVRSYKLKLYGNAAKTDTARYTIMRHNQYANMFLGRLFFGQSKLSTAGMGDTANQALYESRQIIRRQRAAIKQTKAKSNVPIAKRLGCVAYLERKKTSAYDYWVCVANQFGGNRVKLPAKSHKALNRALRDGWSFTNACKCIIRNGELYAIVFVERERPNGYNPSQAIGVDVGYKYSLVTSRGHVGRNIKKVLLRSKEIRAQRQRSGIRKTSSKTAIKQVLDREAKKLIGRSKKLSACIAVEDPKRLAPLTGRNLHGWATSYVAKRLEILGAEQGVTVVSVSPYQTSIQCSKCLTIDKQHRVSRDRFECKCGYKDHADINAAKNIARIGFPKKVIKRGKS